MLLTTGWCVAPPTPPCFPPPAPLALWDPGGLKMAQRLFVLFALLSISATAQWLNYPTPGTPRTPDGKPNLSAPTPRAVDGKPDLSGAWHAQPPSIAEMKRLFGGAAIDNAVNLSVPGMEVDSVSKYAVNILLDFKPEEAPMRPDALA